MEQAGTQGHVLIISHDVVGERMAGPGIRYYYLARTLAEEFDVVLAVPAESTLTPSRDFRVISYRSEEDGTLRSAVQGAHTVLAPAVWLAEVPLLRKSLVPLVIDGYNPIMPETLALGKQTGLFQRVLTLAYLRGDFFICASERQRDWWLGLLEANGRVNRYTFDEDPSLRRLIDVVPFGLPGEQLHASGRVLGDIWPGIGPEDKVILWGGGLWSWLDPLTAIRAVAEIWPQRQDIKLVFPGVRHPNPGMAGLPTHNEEAFRTAQELGVLDKAVFFGEWVPYDEWPDVLTGSDVALTLHYDTLETRLAFRSRVLDYIWAGLPIVTTRGDATSDLIKEYGLGIVVDYEDVEGVAEALFRLLETPSDAFSDRFEKARRELRWERVVRPLAEFCRRPRRAPDRVALGDELGNPFYVEERRRLIGERDRWQELVEQYEQGRFIRSMRKLHHLRERLGWFRTKEDA